MPELQHLDRSDCLSLLAENRFGRLAINIQGQAPAIRPVNYVFDERSQSIVFRTGGGSKLYALLTRRKAAFEIDGLDLRDRTGWSVIVTGMAEEIVSPVELRRLERLPLDTWAPGEKPRWIRIRAWTVSGRRIVESERVVEPDREAGAHSGY
jgi:uncharacterized protein